MMADSPLLFFHEDQSQIHRYRRDRCLRGKRESVSRMYFFFNRTSQFRDGGVRVDDAHN